MKVLDVEEIKNFISETPFVNSVIGLEWRDYLICGKIEIAFDELEAPLEFEIEIHPQYPFQSYNSETIKFINKNLLEYNHVMENGSICIHTSHDVNLKGKLTKDLNSLKTWIVKYYINKDDDPNYEHIIVPESTANDRYNSYLFTEIDFEFKKGDFGYVHLSLLNVGSYKNKTISNFIVQNFQFSYDKVYECRWSERYKNLDSDHKGFFLFVETAPAHYRRFIFTNWADLRDLIDQKALFSLHNFEKRNQADHSGDAIPIFIGYKTTVTEIHWQVAILKIGEFPLVGVPERVAGRKTGRWKSELTNKEISWALTRNCSFEHFFGRGTLSKKILDKKVLILGVGAIGSIVATTLVRGGFCHIDLADYDVKEPENVCRSEYIFELGLNDKVKELASILSSISPFVEISLFKQDCFEGLIKILHKDPLAKREFEIELNKYDIIFDCTVDNDLMYILDLLDLTCDLINLSITNHANELVCAFHPNIYRFVTNQYINILQNDLEDLYSPTGCWSPTFRASYNDINVLVQTAVKQFNLLYELEKPKNNFVLKTNTEDSFGVEIKEY